MFSAMQSINYKFEDVFAKLEQTAALDRISLNCDENVLCELPGCSVES